VVTFAAVLLAVAAAVGLLGLGSRLGSLGRRLFLGLREGQTDGQLRGPLRLGMNL